MGVVAPKPDFLESLRKITTENDALLIFDEVITGFRVAYGGAQSLFGITPDLTCLGKIIGGGLPVGAYGGKRRIMEMMAPSGPVYQAGTLSGNPLAMTAGIETLKALNVPGVYDRLENSAATLENGLTVSALETDIGIFISRVASLITVFFTTSPVTDYESAKQVDTSLFSRFFHAMLSEGIYWPPSQFEACFISLAHSDEDVRQTIEIADKVLKSL
jgi:glutamate-1-semialdehyde 2,1-aminomutase